MAQNKLKQLGYAFINNRLCSIADGAPFKYDVSPNAARNTERYEQVAAAVTDEVYRQMEARGLQRLYFDSVTVPNAVNSADRKQQSFVFASSNVHTARKLIILIHGGGQVRAGMWARSVIINNGLVEGTQLPYIDRAMKQGFGVLVFNYNLNDVKVLVQSAGDTSRKPKADSIGPRGSYKYFKLPNSETAERHANHAWETFVSGCKAQQIVIVAHSFGGHITLQLAKRFKQTFLERVAAVCFTDSVHSVSDFVTLPPPVRKRLLRIARNWVTSTAPMDSRMRASALAEEDIARLSAGDMRHEWTSHAAFNGVFNFVDTCLNDLQDQSATEGVVNEPVRAGASRTKKARMSDS